jgi:hypothetical protein
MGVVAAVTFFWPYMPDPAIAEEPHRSPILMANVSCLIFPLHRGKMSNAQPLSGLDYYCYYYYYYYYRFTTATRPQFGVKMKPAVLLLLLLLLLPLSRGDFSRCPGTFCIDKPLGARARALFWLNKPNPAIATASPPSVYSSKSSFRCVASSRLCPLTGGKEAITPTHTTNIECYGALLNTYPLYFAQIPSLSHSIPDCKTFIPKSHFTPFYCPGCVRVS